MQSGVSSKTEILDLVKYKIKITNDDFVNVTTVFFRNKLLVHLVMFD